MPIQNITWDIDLNPLLHKRVAIETLEGIVLRGKVTSFEFTELEVAGFTVSIPHRVWLDKTDPVDFPRIKKLERVE